MTQKGDAPYSKRGSARANHSDHGRMQRRPKARSLDMALCLEFVRLRIFILSLRLAWRSYTTGYTLLRLPFIWALAPASQEYTFGIACRRLRPTRGRTRRDAENSSAGHPNLQEVLGPDSAPVRCVWFPPSFVCFFVVCVCACVGCVLFAFGLFCVAISFQVFTVVASVVAKAMAPHCHCIAVVSYALLYL